MKEQLHDHLDYEKSVLRQENSQLAKNHKNGSYGNQVENDMKNFHSVGNVKSPKFK